MATIAWTDEARRWMEDIVEYIAADNPHAAARTVQDIYERTKVLASYPEVGHLHVVSSRKSGFSYTDTIESPTLSRTMEA